MSRSIPCDALAKLEGSGEKASLWGIAAQVASFPVSTRRWDSKRLSCDFVSYRLNDLNYDALPGCHGCLMRWGCVWFSATTGSNVQELIKHCNHARCFGKDLMAWLFLASPVSPGRSKTKTRAALGAKCLAGVMKRRGLCWLWRSQECFFWEICPFQLEHENGREEKQKQRKFWDREPCHSQQVLFSCRNLFTCKEQENCTFPLQVSRMSFVSCKNSFENRRQKSHLSDARGWTVWTHFWQWLFYDAVPASSFPSRPAVMGGNTARTRKLVPKEQQLLTSQRTLMLWLLLVMWISMPYITFRAAQDEGQFFFSLGLHSFEMKSNYCHV